MQTLKAGCIMPTAPPPLLHPNTHALAPAPLPTMSYPIQNMQGGPPVADSSADQPAVPAPTTTTSGSRPALTPRWGSKRCLLRENWLRVAADGTCGVGQQEQRAFENEPLLLGAKLAGMVQSRAGSAGNSLNNQHCSVQAIIHASMQSSWAVRAIAARAPYQLLLRAAGVGHALHREGEGLGGGGCHQGVARRGQAAGQAAVALHLLAIRVGGAGWGWVELGGVGVGGMGLGAPQGEGRKRAPTGCHRAWEEAARSVSQ